VSESRQEESGETDLPWGRTCPGALQQDREDRQACIRIELVEAGAKLVKRNWPREILLAEQATLDCERAGFGAQQTEAMFEGRCCPPVGVSM
jgi:hypothetical protein